MTICSSKIVVFDLDETLGYFMELGMFWDALNTYIKHKQLKIPINQDLFNKVLDLYPEFLRPDIIDILNYLKKKKNKNHCDKLMIYTNNQGPIEWAKYIMNYFEKHINYKIFDKIIAAFKIQGKRVELCRTSHLKTHSDLIKCTKLPEDTQICFLDDVYYPDMSNDKIYYINVKPYIYDLEFNEMITRMLNSNLLADYIDNPTYCREFILAFMKKYNYIYVDKSNESQNVDKIVSKKILQHLHNFFKLKPIEQITDKTSNKVHKITKRYKSIKNKTLKKHNH
jgi:hypothetical protein